MMHDLYNPKDDVSFWLVKLPSSETEVLSRLRNQMGHGCGASSVYIQSYVTCGVLLRIVLHVTCFGGRFHLLHPDFCFVRYIYISVIRNRFRID